ncbi:MAG: hypothetical protein NVSMB12_14030 [Acidimicrobiales bacterium]
MAVPPMRHGGMRMRALGAVGLVLAGLAASAAPAAAHTVTGVASSNYESVLLGPTPTVRGIAVRLRDLGRRVEVANSTSIDLVISGYGGEPFLRVGPGGVYENLRSPTVYENKATITGLPYPVPPEATPGAAPEWNRIGGGHIVRWRDRRTRHEGATPAAVRDAPHRSHLLSTWSISLQWGTTQIVANGLIRWAPPPSLAPWLALAALAGVAVYIASRSDRWAPVLASATAAVVAVDVVHSLVAVVAASDSLAQTSVRLLLAGFVSVSAWIAGAAAVGKIGGHNDDGLFLAIYAAVIIVLTGGIGDAPVLGRSQVPYAVDPVVARVLVSVTIGVSIGVLAGGIGVLRRDRPHFD